MIIKTCKDIAKEFGIEQECSMDDHGFFYEQDLLYTQHFENEIWRVCRGIRDNLKEKNYNINWELKQ